MSKCPDHLWEATAAQRRDLTQEIREKYPDRYGRVPGWVTGIWYAEIQPRSTDKELGVTKPFFREIPYPDNFNFDIEKGMPLVVRVVDDRTCRIVRKKVNNKKRAIL